MAFFELNSDVTIGKFRFTGVHEVQIKRSLHGIVDTAVIKIPSRSRVMKGDRTVDNDVVTGKQFSDGDHVVVRLGYNGLLQTEFEGFVKRRNLTRPLEVECEGYSWLMRQNAGEEFKEAVTLKELLQIAVAGVPGEYMIKVRCDMDINMGNVRLTGMTGLDIINYISTATDSALTCFFIQPDTLWCGTLYTDYAQGNDKLQLGTASYKTGINVISNNSLKARMPGNDMVQVSYARKLASGDLVRHNSTAFKDFTRTHVKVLNQLSAESLGKVADEKAYKLGYPGYEGSIDTFLQPFALPGFAVVMTDEEYKDRDGTYLVESTEVKFGAAGAKRSVGLGPQLGFAKQTK